MNINKVRSVTALSLFLAYAGYQVVKSFINNPLGLDIAYKSSINSSRVCEGISTSVLDEISGTRVVFFENKGEGLKTQGFYFNLSSDIFIRINDFISSRNACYHEAFHAYFDSIDLDFDNLVGLNELKVKALESSDIFTYLYQDIHDLKEFISANQHLLSEEILNNFYSLLQRYNTFLTFPSERNYSTIISSNKSSFDLKQLLKEFYFFTKTLSALNLDLEIKDLKLFSAKFSSRLRTFDYIIDSEELLARLMTSYFYDHSDAILNLNRQSLLGLGFEDFVNRNFK